MIANICAQLGEIMRNETKMIFDQKHYKLQVDRRPKF